MMYVKTKTLRIYLYLSLEDTSVHLMFYFHNYNYLSLIHTLITDKHIQKTHTQANTFNTNLNCLRR